MDQQCLVMMQASTALHGAHMSACVLTLLSLAALNSGTCRPGTGKPSLDGSSPPLNDTGLEGHRQSVLHPHHLSYCVADRPPSRLYRKGGLQKRREKSLQAPQSPWRGQGIPEGKDVRL